MHTLEFVSLLSKDIFLFIIVNILFFLTLSLFIHKTLYGGVINPLYIIFCIGFSTKYAISIFLYIKGYVTLSHISIVIVYLSIFILSLRFSSKVNSRWILKYYCAPVIKPVGSNLFRLLFCAYFLIAAFIIYKIGLGIFAETNRFENARGVGAFVRFIDALTVFLLVFIAILAKSQVKKVNKIVFSLVVLFLLIFSSLINGAKISILFGLIAIYFGLLLHGNIKVIKRRIIIIVGIVGVLFMLVALSINLKMNDINEDNAERIFPGLPFVVERFVNRMISNGNTVYLLLANGVIDEIETDSAVTRFITPMIGISQMSKIVGYNAGDYSVGRQALLYYSRGYSVAGGPTSHFDFFSYVYLGIIPGGFFVFFIGAILGMLSNGIKSYSSSSNKSVVVSAFLVNLWFRTVIVVVEPTVGLAYVADILIIFTVTALFLHTLKGFK